jgi:hypothetical protein
MTSEADCNPRWRTSRERGGGGGGGGAINMGGGGGVVRVAESAGSFGAGSSDKSGSACLGIAGGDAR